jgi:hypothetical protein
MPDRPTLPEPISDQGAARFRADLAAYLNSMFLHEPAELLGELPEPTRVALMHELSERGPAWGQAPRGLAAAPALVTAGAAGRPPVRPPVRPPAPSPEQLRRWRAEADRAADQLGRHRRRGAVAEQRVAEALRARATSRDPAQQHQQRKEPSPGRPPRARDWPSQDCGHGRDHP